LIFVVYFPYYYFSRQDTRETMSFPDPNALINAVKARIPPGGNLADANIDQLFFQLMPIFMEEIQKARQNMANLSEEDFDAGYDAMLAGIDTTGNPGLAQTIADYRSAKTREERDALKPVLVKALEQSADTLERSAFGI
jgi:hypothetical protein